MDDDRLLSDLEQASAGHDDPSRRALDQRLDEIMQRAESLRSGLQYESALALLRRANDIAGPLLQLNRRIALALGARAEIIMGWADRLGVAPPADLLAWIEADLAEARDTDPPWAISPGTWRSFAPAFTPITPGRRIISKRLWLWGTRIP